MSVIFSKLTLKKPERRSAVEKTTCEWCHCEVSGPQHDENGNHLDFFSCKAALMRKVEKLETELARANEKIKRFKDEFIR